MVRDENGEDILDWGPRPAEAQEIVLKMKEAEAPFEEVNQAIQTWYNKDKGSSTLRELRELLVKQLVS